VDYPLLNVFWTILVFFLWILWFILLFRILSDIFRSHDLSGWGKAGWVILVIILPFIGVLVYVIVRGTSMQERDMEQMQRSERAFRSYVRDAAAPEAGGEASHADQLTKLADLHGRGALSDEEFQKAKDKLLA
jgi:hypothetical protein